MVDLILTETQLACLKAAVTIGSEESAALGRGIRVGSKRFSPEPFAVKCTREIATRLLAVATRFSPSTAHQATDHPSGQEPRPVPRWVNGGVSTAAPTSPPG